MGHTQKDGSIRNRDTDPEDWVLFCQYCMDDVSEDGPAKEALQMRIDGAKAAVKKFPPVCAP